MASSDDARAQVRHRLPRRRLVLGGLALATLGMARRAGAAQLPPGATVSGECQAEPGVALLAAFNLGQPVAPIPDLLPPLDWVRYVNRETGLTFLYPPTWTAGTLWAAQLGPNGTPLWTDQKPFVPVLTTGRVVAPDGVARFEAVVGTLYGLVLSPLQAATIAELGVVGEGAPTTPICSYEDPNPLAPAWFRAVAVDERVLVTEGYTLAHPDGFTPNTIVVYYAMIGRRADFEDLMRAVYLRMLFQFLPGGGEAPTPTPEP